MYPVPNSLPQTPTCHFFTKEWGKMGYNVMVIHYQSIFPIFLYWISSLFTKQVARFIGNDNVEKKRRTKDIYFIKDGIPVHSFPLFKLKPHGRYMGIIISKQISKILRLNNSEGFIPDAIIGHFHNPQIEIISKLKGIYPNARTCIVLHESPYEINKTYSKHYKEYMSTIDVWGFRFRSQKEVFEKIYGNKFQTFICHSGIPEQYISITNKKFTHKVQKFCFVGQLIPLKRVCDILYALSEAFPNKDFEFSICGDGHDREELERIVQLLEIQSQVKFYGEISRNEVQNIMADSDSFIMVSKSEAFGLVYLEAMGKGCITIGTRGQGIDGVIIHGYNGFLCEANNSNQLAEIIKYINTLPLEELIKISKNAIQTAKDMTDDKVAINYINSVFLK